ncbi:MAG TPA: SIMPL domain-containing protein, partial [Vicinamibacterales bacterium]|nr:SIMPL domain-containing protein [Vicinamibacterales bacterium]
RREYESDRNGNETLRGYRVSRDMEIKLRAIDKYEQLAKSLTDARIDDIRSVEVDVDDRSALKQRAIVEATRNARREASAIAAELGMTLGAPFEVSEERLVSRHALREATSDSYQEVVVNATRRTLAGTPVSVVVFRPHAIEVTSTVWARFEILEKKVP